VTCPHLLSRGVFTLAGAIAAAFFAACGGPGGGLKPHATNATMMARADSLFSAGDFEGAKSAYKKIRTALPPSSNEARKSHYYIAYIDVYYKNAKGDWDAALTEFNAFAALYPDDPHTNDVRSWIRILTTIKSFEKEYRKMAHRVERLNADKNTTLETQRFHLDSMAAILRSSYESADSLAKKNAELENVIIDLEKKCQQAGR
jgi:tetratricopeptide (TPR) repeat protein